MSKAAVDGIVTDAGEELGEADASRRPEASGAGIGMTGRHVEDAAPLLDSVPAVLRESVGFLLSKAADQIERRFAAALKPYGVSPREYGVLASIAHQGPQSQQQLGERLGIDRTSMVNIIDSLEDTGYVTRVRDRADRRRYAITLSEKGDQLIRGTLFAVDTETHDQYLAVLRRGEDHKLLDILRRLVQTNV